MKSRAFPILIVLIVVLSSLAATFGIFSQQEFPLKEFQSVHGRTVVLWGKGIYHNMSAGVAPQGIAQDYVTLLIAVPLLIIAYFKRHRREGKFLLTGILCYFFVTHNFYMLMAVYNNLFIVYVLLTLCSFLAVCMSLIELYRDTQAYLFPLNFPVKAVAWFLMITCSLIALLWLSIVIPPLFRNAVPNEVEHYTTLVVQGMDLSLALPLGFISGWLLLKRKRLGFVLATVYCVFLCLLMSALNAKVIAMGLLGYNIVPVVFLMPAFLVAAVYLSYRCLHSLRY